MPLWKALARIPPKWGNIARAGCAKWRKDYRLTSSAYLLP